MLTRAKEIVEYFLGRDASTSNQRSRTVRTEKENIQQPATAAGFDTHLRKLIERQGRVSAGMLQVISLDKVRQYVQEDWSEFSKKVASVITDTILRRLGPEDSFVELADGSYVIVFENLNKEDAELECVLIIQEVLRTLFVDRDLDSRVDIRSVAVGVDGSMDVQKVDLLDIISRLLKGEIDNVVNKTKNSSSLKDYAENKNLSSSSLEKGSDTKKITETKWNEGFDVSAFSQVFPKEMRFLYKPFWDVRRKVLSMYACVPKVGSLTSYDILGQGPDPMLIPALDYIVIGRILHEMKILQSKGSRLLISCPVHISTLSDVNNWKTYRLLCERLTKFGLQKDVVFEVFGISDKDDGAKINHCGSKLSPFCRSIILRTDLEYIAPKSLDNGVFSALSTFATESLGSEKRQMRLMDKYVEHATLLRFNAYITGLSKLSQVTAAIGSGFSKVAGPAIHKPTEQPEFVFRFEEKNLLCQIIK